MRQTLTAVVLLACSVSVISARPPVAAQRPAAKTVQAPEAGTASLINANALNMWFRNNGESGNNPLTGNGGVTLGGSETETVVYQDGLVWGGRVLDGQDRRVRVGGSTFITGTTPGGIVSKGVAAPAGSPGTRIWRVRRTLSIDVLRSDAADLLGKAAAQVTSEELAQLRQAYLRDWREWPWQQGAPFYDRDGDGIYTPKFDGEGLPVINAATDEPGLEGASQVAWFAINDLDPGRTTALYGSPPIGLEVQVTLWAYYTDADWDWPGLAEVFHETSPYNTIFKRYTVVYKGTEQTPDDARIEDLYFSQFSDPDIGFHGDDLAGSDPALSLGYVYNVSDDDPHFRTDRVPPALGYAFLNRDATSFGYNASGTGIADPAFGQYEGTLQWFNWMRGFQPTADATAVPQLDPDGLATVFPLDGTPTYSPAYFAMVPGADALALCGGEGTCLGRLTPQVRIAEAGVVAGGDYQVTVGSGVNGLNWDLARVQLNEAGNITSRQEVLIDSPLVSGVAVAENGALELSFPVTTGMQDWDVPTGDRWWTWTGANGFETEGFGGAITGDPSSYWFAPTTVAPERVRRVELRFTNVVEEEGEDQYKPLDLANENVSWGYRYLRNADSPAPTQEELTTTSNPYDWREYIVNREGPGGYIYQDRRPIAVSAWDMDSDPPRRLEVAFLENNVPGGLVNGAYGPAFYRTASNVSSSGPREWLFVMDLDYTDPTEGDNSQVLLDHGLVADSGEAELPIMWISYAARRRDDRFPQDGDSFLMVPFPTPVYQPGDSFTFSVPDNEAPDGWVDGIDLPAGDRRIVLSSGPVAMALGDTQVVDIALVAGRGESHIGSVAALKHNVALARELAAFVPSTPPPASAGEDALSTTGVVVGTLFNGDGRSGDEVSFSWRELGTTGDVAIDAEGNLYVADRDAVRKVFPANDSQVFTVEGTRGFEFISGIAAGRDGYLYFAVPSTVYGVDQTTQERVVIAGGNFGFSGDGGPAAEAGLETVSDLALDRAGNLYISDATNLRVRRVDAATGIISTVAGNGERDFGAVADGVAATETTINGRSIAVDPMGNLYLADGFFAESEDSGLLRRVDAGTGIISTVAGGGANPTPTEAMNGVAATSVRLPEIADIAIDAQGRIHLFSPSWGSVWHFDPVAGTLTTVAGDFQRRFSAAEEGQDARSTGLQFPARGVSNAAGDLYVADWGTARLRRVDSRTGLVQTVAGGRLGDGGSADRAVLNNPRDIALDAAGNLYISDSGHRRVRRVDARTGIIETVAGGSNSGDTEFSLRSPWGLTVDGAGNIYVVDGFAAVVRRIDRSGTVTTVAGNGRIGSGGDEGRATAASINPRDVAVDAAGNLFIVSSRRVRRVDAMTGIISTVVGNGEGRGGISDGSVATATGFSNLGEIVVDEAGDLLVADQQRRRVWHVDLETGIVTTVAGNGEVLADGDGGLATQAGIANPRSLALDGAGHIYIGTNNRDVRRVDRDTGRIATMASWDEVVAAPPDAIAIHDNGTVYVLDRRKAVVLAFPRIATAVTEVVGAALPQQSWLSQNYPNPFNPTTTIEYQVATTGPVELHVYNLMGQRVRQLAADGDHAVGTYRVTWDGRNDAGQPLASGVYIYRLQAGDVVQNLPMTLIK